MDSLGGCFAELDDPRAHFRWYDLTEVLTIALCAVLAGAKTVVDMAVFAEAKQDFLRSFLRLENGVPGRMTFSRVLGNLDPDQFRNCFQRFSSRFGDTCAGVIASDGKTVHRPANQAPPRSTSGVESGERRILNVTMNEDQVRSHNLAILRRMALNLMHKDRSEVSLRSKFNLARWRDDFLVKLLGQA